MSTWSKGGRQFLLQSCRQSKCSQQTGAQLELLSKQLICKLQHGGDLRDAGMMVNQSTSVIPSKIHRKLQVSGGNHGPLVRSLTLVYRDPK